MPNDMLARLWNLPDGSRGEQELLARGIRVKRALAVDRGRVLQYVQQVFGDGWANECAVALSCVPSTCYVAVQEKKVVGFACFDATAKNYFGPTGVDENLRGQGVGKALLLRCLETMRQAGYAYAVIGWVDEAQGFYEKAVGATVIENSHPGIYGQMVRMEHSDFTQI